MCGLLINVVKDWSIIDCIGVSLIKHHGNNATLEVDPGVVPEIIHKKF